MPSRQISISCSATSPAGSPTTRRAARAPSSTRSPPSSPRRSRATGWRASSCPRPPACTCTPSLEGAGRARVALLCHHDTVFPLGTVARRPLRREGDRLIGPGVADMKGGLAVAAHAARLLAAGERPFARLELVSVPDEEVRSEPIATQARLAGFDAVLCMECGRPGGAVVAARKGGRWLDVVARGRSAHAGSEPEHGRNAVLALARELPRIAGARRRAARADAARHAHARRRRAQLDPRRGARDDRHARLARRRPRLGRGPAAARRSRTAA